MPLAYNCFSGRATSRRWKEVNKIPKVPVHWADYFAVTVPRMLDDGLLLVPQAWKASRRS